MLPTEYRMTVPEDKADVIDFANLVFSQAHQPHDFSTLLPKVYGPDAERLAEHFIATQNGKIRGCVGLYKEDYKLGDSMLKLGFVGTVSVHKYSRGEGHMQKLMTMMNDWSDKNGFDLLALGGLRQRYAYFGFEPCGMMYEFTVTSDNVRHALKEVDDSGITFEPMTEENPAGVDFAWKLSQTQPACAIRPRSSFVRIMHSWNCGCDLIRKDGELVGYNMENGRELVLTDDSLLYPVIKAYSRIRNGRSMSFKVLPQETYRMKMLSEIAETFIVKHAEQIRVIRWVPVLNACLKLKAQNTVLEDGEVTVGIDGKNYTVTVENGIPDVRISDKTPDLERTGNQAERLFFGLENLANLNPLLKNWIPLPFTIKSPDLF